MKDNYVSEYDSAIARKLTELLEGMFVQVCLETFRPIKYDSKRLCYLCDHKDGTVSLVTSTEGGYPVVLELPDYEDIINQLDILKKEDFIIEPVNIVRLLHVGKKTLNQI